MKQRLVMAAFCLLLDTGIVTITFDPCDYFRFATNNAYYALQKSGSCYSVAIIMDSVELYRYFGREM